MRKIAGFLFAAFIFPSILFAATPTKAVVNPYTGDLQLIASGSGGVLNVPSKPSDTTGTYGTDGNDNLIAIAGAGGDTTITTTGIGGAGGDNLIIGGLGGSASSANTNSTGGAGGKLIFQGGPGAAATGTGTNIGGKGGNLILAGGEGGKAVNGSSNTNGVGGDLELRGGLGITTGGNVYITPGNGATTNGDIIANYDAGTALRRGHLIVGNNTGTASNYLAEFYVNSASLTWDWNFRNAAAGTAAMSRLTFGNDLAEANYHPAFSEYSSGHTSTFLGITVANYFAYVGQGSSYNGLLIGNTVAKPIVFGTNNAENFRIASGGHLETKGTTPVVSACGTSPSIVGNDNNGQVTVGTGGVASSCTVTFASTWANAPSCISNAEGAILVTRSVATTTVLTIDAATPFTASGVIDYQCRGRN